MTLLAFVPIFVIYLAIQPLLEPKPSNPTDYNGDFPFEISDTVIELLDCVRTSSNRAISEVAARSAGADEYTLHSFLEPLAFDGQAETYGRKVQDNSIEIMPMADLSKFLFP